MAPNLFYYATKELSQDAFICWLLAWADRECQSDDEALHSVGLSLVSRLLEMHGEPRSQPITVKVHRQLMRVDVVAEIGNEIVVLIEDKIHAGLHGDQLVRYRREIERQFEGKRILPVFLKTGDQSSYEAVEQAGYKLLLREQIIELLRPWRDRVSNAIFSDFLSNLEWRDAQIESYVTKPVSAWTKDWEPWIGFYKRLQREIPGGVEWDYVANAAGGFLGAWWHFIGWTDPSTRIEHDVYLQIEQGPLCFKIAVSEEETDRACLRERWHTRLMTTAREIGLDVTRPTRMGSGTYMTVGRIELKDWMAERQDGLLDLPRTLATLRATASLLDRAVSS